MRQAIVVGTDLTEASEDALLQAEARAHRDQVPLTVLHALAPGLRDAPRDRAKVDSLRRAVRDQVTAVTARPARFFEVVIARGAPHSTLARVAQARGAMVFVGSHLERRVGHSWLRDVPERLVSQALPVFVSKPSHGSKRILVALASALDDGPTLDAAIEEARESESTLVVMHSVHRGFLELMAEDFINGGVYAAHPLGERSEVVRARRQIGSELARRGVSAELHVVDGPPELAIPDVAERTGVDLIIVGAPHAPAPISRVATAVLRHAPCSVLVVDATAKPVETAAKQAVAASSAR